MSALSLMNAEEVRDSILASQQKEIAALYEKWADEVSATGKKLSKSSTPSSSLQAYQKKILEKQLREAGEVATKAAEGVVKKNMLEVAETMAVDNAKWLTDMGMSGLNFSSVPKNVVNNISTGKIYQGGWNLSKSIWSDNEDTMKKAYEVVAGGIAQNKSMYDISKDLEQYVRPSAKKSWNLKAADGKRIYPKQVDYNSQRLGRTLVQHSYQQSFVECTKDNPMITKYKWDSNGPRVCEICIARNGKEYPKDSLPLDHPNGMCTMVPVMAKNPEQMIADWVNNPDGTYPEMDNFASKFGYTAKAGETTKAAATGISKELQNDIDDFVGNFGKSNKKMTSWFNSMPSTQKAQAKVLKKSTGKSWDDFFETFIFDGDPSALAKTTKTVTTKKTTAAAKVIPETKVTKAADVVDTKATEFVLNEADDKVMKALINKHGIIETPDLWGVEDWRKKLSAAEKTKFNKITKSNKLIVGELKEIQEKIGIDANAATNTVKTSTKKVVLDKTNDKHLKELIENNGKFTGKTSAEFDAFLDTLEGFDRSFFLDVASDVSYDFEKLSKIFDEIDDIYQLTAKNLIKPVTEKLKLSNGKTVDESLSFISNKEFVSLADEFANKATKKSVNIIEGGSHSQRYVASSNSFRINQKLRTGKLDELSNENKITVNALTKEIDNFELDKDLWSYRYVDKDAFASWAGIETERGLGKLSLQDLSKKLVTGRTTKQNQFTSVSLVDGDNVFTGKPIRLNIFMPKKTKMYVTKNETESEAILGIGQEFKLIEHKVVKDRWGSEELVISVEVIN